MSGRCIHATEQAHQEEKISSSGRQLSALRLCESAQQRADSDQQLSLLPCTSLSYLCLGSRLTPDTRFALLPANATPWRQGAWGCKARKGRWRNASGNTRQGFSGRPGGGIDSSRTLTIIQATICGNTLSGLGDGIYAEGRMLIILGCTLSSNEAVGRTEALAHGSLRIRRMITLTDKNDPRMGWRHGSNGAGIDSRCHIAVHAGGGTCFAQARARASNFQQPQQRTRSRSPRYACEGVLS
jgi:hypothetical protein